MTALGMGMFEEGDSLRAFRIASALKPASNKKKKILFTFTAE